MANNSSSNNKQKHQPTNHNMNNKNNNHNMNNMNNNQFWSFLEFWPLPMLPCSHGQICSMTMQLIQDPLKSPHEPGTASHFWFGAIFSNPKKDVGRVFSHLISAKLMLEQSPYKIEGWCDTYPMLQMESGPLEWNPPRFWNLNGLGFSWGRSPAVLHFCPKNSGATEHSHVRACDRTQPGNLRIRGCWDVEENGQKISIGFVWCASFIFLQSGAEIYRHMINLHQKYFHQKFKAPTQGLLFGSSLLRE